MMASALPTTPRGEHKLPPIGPSGAAKVAARCWDVQTMRASLPADVMARFEDALITAAPTSKGDQAQIAESLYKWATSFGALYMTHWFFPLRTGGGLQGGHGGQKHDLMIDLDWGTPGVRKPFVNKLPTSMLFSGETDGSSFPNGGLRQTHTAAAFLSWDRGSAPFVHDKCLFLPAAFIAYTGSPLDEKTPLLRAMDAIHREGMRFVKNLGFAGAATAKQATSYLGWEQEFFIVSAEMYAKRPDLLACGRTVFGAGAPRAQQADLNYFARMPFRVEKFLEEMSAELMACGVAMACIHNEVAPGQHECSPIFCVANQSCDQNQLMMDVAAKIAEKHGLVVLFHEKPFAGINGSGKHSNWSVGLDNGVNFFKSGKDKGRQELFMAAVGALMYAVNQHCDCFRIACSGAGNDHRLGAQEAPPAIMSLYPGKILEKKIQDIIAGGELAGYVGEGNQLPTGASALMPTIETGPEDRNRTAPFPFCSNRFEFRAVGSSQNCSWPMTMVNTAYADGMAAISALIEGGKSPRDAVATIMKDNLPVVFTGNGYSAEWPVEAVKRGLPNNNNTYKATKAFNSQKTKDLFAKHKVFSPADIDARQEALFENFATVLEIEAETMCRMVDQGITPALVRDLAAYAAFPAFAGPRATLYEEVLSTCANLKKVKAAIPHEPEAACKYCTETLKPAMATLREKVDASELLCKSDLWPYPTYAEILYSHHTK